MTKLNKHQTLEFIKSHGEIISRDLILNFGLSPSGARSYLSHLKRQYLVDNSGKGVFILTGAGIDRLNFFDENACPRPECPICLEKREREEDNER